MLSSQRIRSFYSFWRAGSHLDESKLFNFCSVCLENQHFNDQSSWWLKRNSLSQLWTLHLATSRWTSLCLLMTPCLSHSQATTKSPMSWISPWALLATIGRTSFACVWRTTWKHVCSNVSVLVSPRSENQNSYWFTFCFHFLTRSLFSSWLLKKRGWKVWASLWLSVEFCCMQAFIVNFQYLPVDSRSFRSSHKWTSAFSWRSLAFASISSRWCLARF